MNLLKKFLLSVLGEKKYLALLSSGFQRMFRMNLLPAEYQDVYFLRQIINPGFNCVDIGAHLGYYTFELSRLAGKNGKIFAIEPMSKFNRTIASVLQKKQIANVELLQLALGGTGEFVEMGIPSIAGNKKFAYARVKESSAYLDYVESEKVKNETGDHLFENLPHLEFIKCDVEGLEVSVFSSMMQTVKKHLPVLLCELADQKDRVLLFEMLSPLGYKAYMLNQKQLQPLDIYGEDRPISHNHYFIPETHRERFKINHPAD